jgi:hypothetical protein
VAALTLAVVLAGCGSGATSSSTTTTAAAAGQTTTSRAAIPAHHPRTSYSAGKAGQTASAKRLKRHSPAVAHVVAAKTVAAKTVSVHVIRARRPVSSTAGVTRTLTGTGNQPIGNLSERSTVVLEWSTAAGPIQIFNPHGFLLVNSSAATGTVRLARGDYKGLRVAAKGYWTIRLHAA